VEKPRTPWEAAFTASQLRGVVAHVPGVGYGIARLIPTGGPDALPNPTTILMAVYNGRPHFLTGAYIDAKTNMYRAKGQLADGTTPEGREELYALGLTVRGVTELLSGYPEFGYEPPGGMDEQHPWCVEGLALRDVLDFFRTRDTPYRLAIGSLMPNAMRQVDIKFSGGVFSLLSPCCTTSRETFGDVDPYALSYFLQDVFHKREAGTAYMQKMRQQYGDKPPGGIRGKRRDA